MKRYLLLLGSFFIGALPLHSLFADFSGPCPAGQTPGTNGCITATASDTSNLSTNTNNILRLDKDDLRQGNVDMDTIPYVIVNIINVLLGIAGTVSIFALIYYAVRMQLSSGISGDSSGVDNAKKGMKGALLGFILAIMAWFIVARIVDFLTHVS